MARKKSRKIVKKASKKKDLLLFLAGQNQYLEELRTKLCLLAKDKLVPEAHFQFKTFKFIDTEAEYEKTLSHFNRCVSMIKQTEHELDEIRRIELDAQLYSFHAGKTPIGDWEQPELF